MKIYHQLGHNHKWALDAHFKNNIGDGFIFSAYSFKYKSIGDNISSYKSSEYINKSMIDLQFYGSKGSVGGSLDTYPFNPISLKDDDSTQIQGSELVLKGVEYQISLGINNIIIPMIYYDTNNVEKTISFISKISKKISSLKKNNTQCKFYMTLPFDYLTIIDDDKVEKVLQVTTDMNISFDGYYVVCDYNPGYKKKISIDYDYYRNLLRVFSVLNKQGFYTIYGYANWDSLVFNALTNINYITIGTYENLRRFNIKRFTESPAGGASKGWYFSEKLLNFVRAEELKNIRNSKCLDLISNERNIFSDVILDSDYIWNTHKPEVHKNYLLSISRLLSDMYNISSIKERALYMLGKIEEARNLYMRLEKDFKVYLNDENSDYHLGMWASFIKKYTVD